MVPKGSNWTKVTLWIPEFCFGVAIRIRSVRQLLLAAYRPLQPPKAPFRRVSKQELWPRRRTSFYLLTEDCWKLRSKQTLGFAKNLRKVISWTDKCAFWLLRYASETNESETMAATIWHSEGVAFWKRNHLQVLIQQMHLPLVTSTTAILQEGNGTAHPLPVVR